jgi:hypothetical protein
MARERPSLGMNRPSLLVLLAWLSLAAWVLCNRGLHPGPALPPGLAGTR